MFCFVFNQDEYIHCKIGKKKVFQCVIFHELIDRLSYENRKTQLPSTPDKKFPINPNFSLYLLHIIIVISNKAYKIIN